MFLRYLIGAILYLSSVSSTELDFGDIFNRWGPFPSHPKLNVNNTRVKRQATDGRVTIDFPDDAILEWAFKLVTPLWSYGDAKAKGDYRVEVTMELPNELKRKRKRRSLSEDQATLYSIIADGLNKSGLDGETCIQRTICELAETPLHEFGMFGDLINLIFSPGYKTEEPTEDHTHAEDYGRTFGSCWAAFPHCPINMRDVLIDFLKDNSDIPMSM